MPWFYDSYSGKLVHEDPPSPGYYAYLAETKLGLGWHELGVADSATAAQAAAWVTANITGGAAPTTSNNPLTLGGNAVSQGAGSLAGSLASSIPGLSQLGSFLAALGQASTWERVAEVLIGAALIVAGAAHLLDVKLPSAVPVPV